jgi:hypothetical protein
MRAQKARDAVAALQSSIGSTQLILRNFTGEDKVLATWTGTQSTLTPARWQTMGVLQLGSVKLSGHKVTLQCVRHILIKDDKDQLALYPEPTKVQIEVDLGDADPAAVLSKIKDDLFFASVSDAVNAIPKELKSSVPARMDKSPVPEKVALTTSQPACDCAEKENPACEADKRPRRGMVPPKLLKSKDPEFTDAARHGFVDSHVLIGLKVDETGRPNDVWVLRPVGMGLDEAAAKSVLTYVFRPAMCHDAPVVVFLNVDVRFQRN